MGSIFSDQKVEARWEDLSSLSKRMKNVQYLQAPVTKGSFLFAIGQPEVQTRLVAKMTLSFSTGTKSETLGQLLL